MPIESEAQRRAMEAAAHGHSNLGIPKKVAQEYLAKDDHDIKGFMDKAQKGNGAALLTHFDRK